LMEKKGIKSRTGDPHGSRYWENMLTMGRDGPQHRGFHVSRVLMETRVHGIV
jgi:hypothetical protein